MICGIRMAVCLGMLCGVAFCPSGSFAADRAAQGGRTVTKTVASPSPEKGGVHEKGGSQARHNAAAMFPAMNLPKASPEEIAKLREAAAVYGKKDYPKAVAILTSLADAGSARAAFSLGLMAMRGHGMPMSTEVAERWWITSARGGFPDAQYHLGFMYHQGLRGARNPEVIARLWSLAAAQGQGDAMYGMGFMYRAGDGIPKDEKKSLKMFTDAADLGHPGAACEAGLMFKYGRGGAPKDPGKAGTYLKKAADAGVPQARQELAKNP